MNLNKLLKAHSIESKINSLLSNEIKRIDQLKIEIGISDIKEIYIIFEMPTDKNKLMMNLSEISDFLEKIKNK